MRNFAIHRRAVGRSLAAGALLVAAFGVGAVRAADEATIDPPSEGAQVRRIVVLGDSLTKGYGLLESEAYPALLERRLHDEGRTGWKVLNGGVSGDTSAGGLRRLDWLLRARPDIVVIALGGNDGLRGIAPEETEKNLQAIIDKARAAAPDAKIVIAGMTVPENMGPEFRTRFEAIFPRLAEANKAALVPFLLEGVAGDDDLNQDDRIHPNAEGQIRIADNVWKLLAPLVRSAS